MTGRQKVGEGVSEIRGVQKTGGIVQGVQKML